MKHLAKQGEFKRRLAAHPRLVAAVMDLWKANADLQKL
jgi:hypothetical protein